MTKTFEICVHGCDDTTRVHMELTDEEAIVVKRLAKLVTETSTYGCMPVMDVQEAESE